MHKVDQEVSAALAKYEDQRIRAGAPSCIHAQRNAVQVVLDHRVSPTDVIDRLILLASKSGPPIAEGPSENMPTATKPAKTAKARKETV